MRHITLFLLALTLFLNGCGETFTKGSLSTTGVPSTVGLLVTQTPTPIVIPSATPSMGSTPTLKPTSTPTQMLTPTPLPHPMSIMAMRAGSYPGSDITIEKELTPGSNYRRFYASYQSEGLKIYALLTVPNGEMPAGGWPSIVFNHGYIPPTVYRTTERYITYVDNLARAGYIIFRIDYRGNDQSEGYAKGAYGDPGYTVDVLNAVSSIKRFPQANPLKIGMYGHSMGGFLTLRVMVISKDIKVGVIWSGVVGSYADILYNWHHIGPTPTSTPNTRSWRKDWIDQYGTPEQNPGFWNSVSANTYLADLSGPLQLQHSLTDEEVPPEFSQKLAQDIQAVGGTVELFTYKKDDHNLSMDFTLAMNRTIEFINRYLK